MPVLTQKHNSPHHAHIRKLELLFVATASVAIVTSCATGFFLYKNLKASHESTSGVQQKLSVDTAESQMGTVHSKLGFTVKFDKKLFNSDATVLRPDGTAESYKDEEVFKPNDFAILNIYKNNKTNKKTSTVNDELSELSINTNVRKDFFERRKSEFGDLSQLDLTEKFYTPKTDDQTKYTLLQKSDETIGNITYRKLEFSEESQQLSSLSGKLKPLKYYLYVTVQNNRPYAVKITGIGQESPNLAAFQSILYNTTYPSLDNDAQLSANTGQETAMPEHRSLLSAFWGRLSPQVHAAVSDSKTATIDDETIKVVATNTPAVVQIASAYCGAVTIDDGRYAVNVPNSCVQAGGTGFFVSSDGYIATNGHVIKFTPSELVAINFMQGNPNVIVPVIAFVAGTNNPAKINSIISSISNDEAAIQQIANYILTEPPTSFKVAQEISQYAVQLGTEPIKPNTGGNIEQLFSYTDGVVKASLKDLDFNSADLYSGNGFTASDVALLKVDGTKYPYVHLGSIDGLTLGSGLTVIGYPGLAEENGLTDTSTSQATATKGIVSALREATGNRKKLIQSDVSIDHGNSGGPAFNNNGEVVGLATYGIKLPDSSGTFNYMRDVQDLKDLIAKNNINLSQTSNTQSQWEKGLQKFSKAHYSKAIKSFEAVLVDYPNHNLAQKYIDIAKDKIAHGEEATDPKFIIIMVTASVILVGGGTIVLVLIIKHRRHLKNSGMYPPTQPGNSSVFTPPPAPPAPNNNSSGTSLTIQSPVTTQANAVSPQQINNSSSTPSLVHTQLPPQPANNPQFIAGNSMQQQIIQPSQQAPVNQDNNLT
ncbi:hypothetical protein A3D14_03730 [Candidatus Saccharibacteria bacterium RIFCSPHIGHO2_02_FULL_47_12]|nr:MAG: hypothetical protein A3D14_03730 [Candidatus Saccharibacteria bacterium RIFCSPHIGHO2_02_FULL_47_12]